jgi:CIC family chloride channel protein
VRLRTSDALLVTVAIAVGALSGFGAIVFRWLITTFTRWFTGFEDYSGAGRRPNPHIPWLGPSFVLLTPVIAGLVYGPLVYFFAREARGHGVPEVMYAVARRGGRIPPQVAAVKALASALTIGGGGSVGREGPIVQIGSALGSTAGRLVRADETRMRLLVACGAAGGIAATFNAPLAGVFFAMELILRDFAVRAFGAVVLSSVISSTIGRAAFGDRPFLTLPAFTVAHPGEYLLFAALGVIAGAIGVVFSKVLYAIEDVCDGAWRSRPEWLRPAVGGVLLGGVLLALPQLYGVGYPIIGDGLTGAYSAGFLLVLLLGKILATSLTIGIGGSGGVFAPSLFIGAMLGSAFGQAASASFPGWAGPAGAYGLIGMGAVFAGAARAPITAVLILFELTGEYTIILPLMAAIVLATVTSHLLSHDTIYTRKLLRRGVDIGATPASPGLDTVTAGAIAEPRGPMLLAGDPLPAAAARLSASPHGLLPVADAAGRYLGIATARGVAEKMANNQFDPEDSSPPVTVEAILDTPPTLGTATILRDCLDALEHSSDQPVPVLDRTGDALVGWLTPQAVLRALRTTAGASPTRGPAATCAAPADRLRVDTARCAPEASSARCQKPAQSRPGTRHTAQEPGTRPPPAAKPPGRSGPPPSRPGRPADPDTDAR